MYVFKLVLTLPIAFHMSQVAERIGAILYSETRAIYPIDNRKYQIGYSNNTWLHPIRGEYDIAKDTLTEYQSKEWILYSRYGFSPNQIEAIHYGFKISHYILEDGTDVSLQIGGDANEIA